MRSSFIIPLAAAFTAVLLLSSCGDTAESSSGLKAEPRAFTIDPSAPSQDQIDKEREVIRGIVQSNYDVGSDALPEVLEHPDSVYLAGPLYDYSVTLEDNGSAEGGGSYGGTYVLIVNDEPEVCFSVDAETESATFPRVPVIVKEAWRTNGTCAHVYLTDSGESFERWIAGGKLDPEEEDLSIPEGITFEEQHLEPVYKLEIETR